MNNNTTIIRLSVTNDVRKTLAVAKKRYPALSDPEIFKLGLSKIATEDYDGYRLGLRKTSFASELSRIDSEAFLSDGGVAVATLTADRELMDDSGSSGETGILRKPSRLLEKDRKEIARSASYAVGQDYLIDPDEDMGQKVNFS